MIPYATSIRFMIAGYTVIFVILAVYIISLILRWRRLKRDLRMLQDLNK
jgi:CcmD family protein